ncbi:MAG: hypothetical protein P8X95_27655 [Anaerolineales bacterium]
MGGQASRLGMRPLQMFLRVDGDGRLGMGPLQAFLWGPGQPLGDAVAAGVFVGGPGQPLRMRRLRAFLLRSFLTQRHFLYKLGEK